MPKNRIPNSEVPFDWGSLGVIALPAEVWDQGCECEQDWNCPMHANRRGTYLETRYEGMDRDEAIAYGAWWDL